jgi:hypothetical protein
LLRLLACTLTEYLAQTELLKSRSDAAFFMAR